MVYNDCNTATHENSIFLNGPLLFVDASIVNIRSVSVMPIAEGVQITMHENTTETAEGY